MNQPLQIYHVDFLGPMPPTDKKYRYVFVIIDSLTKFCWLYCTKYLSASDAINMLEKNHEKFGHPMRIVTHRHYALDTMELKNYCFRNGIEYVRLQNECLEGYGSERLLFESISSLLLGVAKKYKDQWYTKLRSIQIVINRTADTDVIRDILKRNSKDKSGKYSDDIQMIYFSKSNIFVLCLSILYGKGIYYYFFGETRQCKNYNLPELSGKTSI